MTIKNSLENKRRWSNSKYKEKLKKSLKNHNLGKHWKLTEKTKKKMKNNWTFIRRKQASLSHSGENNSMYGKHHSKETKQKISIAQKTIHLKCPDSYHHSKKTCKKISLSNKRAWKRPDVKIKVKLGQQRHRQAVLEEIKNYKKQGFDVFDSDYLHPDIIARKNGKIYAIEVEFNRQPFFDKYNEISFFDDIIWIRRQKAIYK